MAADYNEIDNLVVQYQDDDKDAANKLIQMFENYLNKYLYLLKRKKISYKDIDTRKFLALFTDDIEERKLLKSPVNSSNVNQLAYKIAEKLSQQLKNVAEEDIKQDLSMILLILAARYKNQGKNFCLYVFSTFRYELKRTVESYVNDPANYSINYEDLENDPTMSDNYSFEATLIESDDALDINWIHGITCSDEFMDLSTMERLILKMHYELKMSDPAISKILGVHKNTVFNRRTKALKKIRPNN